MVHRQGGFTRKTGHNQAYCSDLYAKIRFSENPVRFDVVELNMTKDYEPKNIQILKNAF